MNIPWRLKSIIFKLVDVFHLSKALYFLQKYVTKRSGNGVRSISPNWEVHKKVLEQYRATDIIFEFGAGKTLAQNLFLSDIVNKQVVIDLYPMVDFELVNNARRHISDVLVLKSDTDIFSSAELALYGIEYMAPCDASMTGFADKSLDACISTNTLEHIPYEIIISIFTELNRTLKDDGIVSAKIDYSDHYSHTDKSLSLLNFLKFDENTWKKYNHSCHFQNRLRHYDYVEIFNRCGFVVVEESLVFAEKNVPSELDKAFKDRDEKWRATSAHIILKKSG